MSEPLEVQFPSQGWKQIITARKAILDAFDTAREQARAHEVETYHGRVAEAEIRKWLVQFLPKRYGVTSVTLYPRASRAPTRRLIMMSSFMIK